MSKFVVVVFPDEAKAHEGRGVLSSLHAECSLSVYSMAMLTKSADGKVTVNDEEGPGPDGLAVGTLLGGLVGLIGGPAVAALGAAGGALAGGWRDALHLGVATDFLDEVSRELKPSRSALVAEVTEEWVTPLDARMEEIGGVILRERPSDLEAERLATEAEARRAELAQREVELAEREAERTQADEAAAIARLKARIDESRVKLAGTASRARAAIDRMKAETEAKLATLQEQLRTAKADAKPQVERRLAELRADHERRAAKLRQASDPAREASGP